MRLKERIDSWLKGTRLKDEPVRHPAVWEQPESRILHRNAKLERENLQLRELISEAHFHDAEGKIGKMGVVPIRLLRKFHVAA
jgi:hypothetical protein